MPGLVPGIPKRMHNASFLRRDARRQAPGMTNRKFLNNGTAETTSRDSPPGGSQRQLRVGELVRHALAEMLARGDVHDPVIEGHMITIPEVRVTADLRLATIYVMPLGGRTPKKLSPPSSATRNFCAPKSRTAINLKFAPDIRFRVDDRFAEAERIDKLLRSPEVQRDLKHDEDSE